MFLRSFLSLSILGLAFSVAGAEQVKGKIKSVDVDKNTVTITVDDKDQTFEVPKTAKVFSLGYAKKGKVPKEVPLDGGIGGLKIDSGVTVTTEKMDGKDVVTSIQLDGTAKKKKKKKNDN